MVTDLRQSKSALHVEDDKTWQSLILGCLQDAGYGIIIQTDNLRDAVTESERQKFDVYVVDGRFPLVPGGREVEGAGLQLYEKIRPLHEDPLKYAIVSGDTGLEGDCMKRGINLFEKGKFNYKNFMDYRDILCGLKPAASL